MRLALGAALQLCSGMSLLNDEVLRLVEGEQGAPANSNAADAFERFDVSALLSGWSPTPWGGPKTLAHQAPVPPPEFEVYDFDELQRAA